MSADDTATSDIERVTGNRRGTQAALIAGSALGLAASGRDQAVEAARGKKGKKNTGSTGGPTLGRSLPSVRYVCKTTTFDSSCGVTASATCPSGYLPVDAGLSSSIPEPVILSSMSQLDGNSWKFELNDARPNLQATVTAACLAASDNTTMEDTEHRSTRRKRGKRGRKE